jgi:hypothetical protein
MCFTEFGQAIPFAKRTDITGAGHNAISFSITFFVILTISGIV